jgi:hypothetical protein
VYYTVQSLLIDPAYVECKRNEMQMSFPKKSVHISAASVCQATVRRVATMRHSVQTLGYETETRRVAVRWMAETRDFSLFLCYEASRLVSVPTPTPVECTYKTTFPLR